MTVHVLLDPGGYAENPADLSCSTCDTVFITSDQDPIEAEKLVGVLQVHMNNCPGEPEKSAELFHRACGTQLLHFRGEPQRHRCGLCNRAVSAAEQVRHTLLWVTYTSFNFTPACTCGWQGQHGHMLEKDAVAEFNRHPKAEAPRKLHSVKETGQ
jgi:uncharacterized protein with PIN domain